MTPVLLCGHMCGPWESELRVGCWSQWQALLHRINSRVIGKAKPHRQWVRIIVTPPISSLCRNWPVSVQSFGLLHHAPPEGRYGSINELSEWPMRSLGFVGRRKARPPNLILLALIHLVSWQLAETVSRLVRKLSATVHDFSRKSCTVAESLQCNESQFEFAAHFSGVELQGWGV